MKKIFVAIICILAVTRSFGQSDSMPPGSERYPVIPPFTLLKIDSTNMSRDDLKKNKLTMIMYFSPDCDHCRHQTDSMLANFKSFKDVEVLMATYQPFDEMKSFYKEYKLGQYPNIKIGRDIKFFMPPFFKIKNLPFMALYDKKGKLITTFEGTTPVKKITKAFKIS